MVDTLSAALRALSFVALFQAAGVAMFLALFGRLLSTTHDAVRRVGSLSALIALGLLLAQYLLEAARMSGEVSGIMDPSLQALVLHSSAATALAWRLAGLAFILVSLRSDTVTSAVFSVTGVVLLITAFALMGHTASHPQRWLTTLLLVAHLLVVAFWFGALAPLHIASSREAPMTAAMVINAFSATALWIVPLLFAAGATLCALLLPDLASALRTTYGQLLIVKVAGFAILMGLAALNKWRLGPAVASGDMRVAVAFRRSLKAEYLLIVGVLSVTAALTSFYSPD